MHANRRQFLKLVSFTAAAPLLARCGQGVDLVKPQKLRTDVTRGVRTFSGVAAPQNLEVSGNRMLYELFPRANNPFSIGTDRQLGAGGMNLRVTDRTLGGVIPSAG